MRWSKRIYDMVFSPIYTCIYIIHPRSSFPAVMYTAYLLPNDYMEDDLYKREQMLADLLNAFGKYNIFAWFVALFFILITFQFLFIFFSSYFFLDEGGRDVLFYLWIIFPHFI